MTTTFHMCISIAGVLRWPDSELVKMFTDDAGTVLEADFLRGALMAELAAGKKVLPFGKPCEGWNDQTGCPGHPERTT